MFANLILVSCSLFYFTDSAFVDTIKKCSIHDDKCLMESYGGAIINIGKTGIPELGIAPIDPIALKDETLSIVDLVKVTLVDGTVTGITNCRFDKFKVDIKRERGNSELSCDLLTIQGKYKLFADSPLVKTLLNGSDIHGDGHGKITLDKIILKMDFPFYAQNRDGVIYLKCDYKSGNYDYEVKGKVAFEADNLYLGGKESSKEVVEMMNANWKIIMSSVGQRFVGKAIDIYSQISSKFFENVPAKDFILEDLTPYARP